MSLTYAEAVEFCHERDQVCHGYANTCACARCSDREARRALGLSADEAQRESADYFRRPWKFDNSVPPRPLKNDLPRPGKHQTPGG